MTDLSSVQHRKSGGRYDVLRHSVPAQCSTGPIQEGDGVTVYANPAGHWFCRKTAEFCDGRFEPIEQAGSAVPHQALTWRDLPLVALLLVPLLVTAFTLVVHVREHGWTMPKHQEHGFSRYYWGPER